MTSKKMVTTQGGEFCVKAHRIQPGTVWVGEGSRHEKSKKTPWRRWAHKILLQGEGSGAIPEVGEGFPVRRLERIRAKAERGVWGVEMGGTRRQRDRFLFCLAL